MSSLLETLPAVYTTVCPLVMAALLLQARTHSQSLALPTATVSQILAATGVSRSSAYELARTLADVLPTLSPQRGRPPKAPPPPSTISHQRLTHAVLGYIMEHPGCVERGPRRQHYSDGFRHFVLDLRAEHEALEIEVFAEATQLPLGTLKDWLRSPTRLADVPESAPLDVKDIQMQTVLDAWSRWKGSFLAFCTHVRNELRVSFGRDLVARVLAVHGQRRRARRKGRSPDECAMRGAFRTYFPGAQWVGDGMQIPIVINDQRLLFNLELNVDAHTGAFVGVSVRREEDAAAVVEAFNDGVQTAGAAPIAVLLDNRPSNFTTEVERALGDTLQIRATPERPQNKAHVEGAFGLFSRVLPELVFETHRGNEALAHALLHTLALIWTRTTNHRPRADRGGRSRFDLYAESPTQEQIENARRELQETADRQEHARRTLEARRRPDVLAMLDDHFARLELLDPARHLRVAIAGYPMEAILDGIAIFEGKRDAKTLPQGVDGRYLLGIVRNLAAQTEGEHIARKLFELRLEMRDSMLAALVTSRNAVLAGAKALTDCVDRALATKSPLERSFWLDALAHVIRSRDPKQHKPLFLDAARRIEATFDVTPRERHDAVRALNDRILAIA
jgi:hypothetical protein